MFKRYHRDSASSQAQVIGAILLIALGAVFLAQQAGILQASSNWWVIFLVIPGLGLLWDALVGYQKEHSVTQALAVEAILGLILVILTMIFIFDPTWSFFGSSFRSGVWDRLWRFVVLGLGLVLLVVGFVRRWIGMAVFGALVSIAGVVFIFDINWNYVWPLALIIPGLALLYNSLRRPPAS